MTKREHAYGRDCWCNPYLLTVGSKFITDYAGIIVATNELPSGDIAVHIEPHADALPAAKE
jgi:hypothetical protein